MYTTVSKQTSISVTRMLRAENGESVPMGHYMRIVVEVSGEPDASTGRLVDTDAISRIVKKYDRKLLNDSLDNPTNERLAAMLFDEIREILPKEWIRLRVTVHESDYVSAIVVRYKS